MENRYKENPMYQIALGIVLMVFVSMAYVYADYSTSSVTVQHDNRCTTNATIITVGECEYVVASSLLFRQDPSVAIVHHSNCRYCRSRNSKK